MARRMIGGRSEFSVIFVELESWRSAVAEGMSALGGPATRAAFVEVRALGAVARKCATGCLKAPA